METLDGIYQLRAANKERDFLTELKKDANQIWLDADKYTWQSEAAGRLSFLFLLGFELFRAIAVLMVLFSDLTIGQIFAVFGYLWFMLGPVQERLVFSSHGIVQKQQCKELTLCCHWMKNCAQAIPSTHLQN